MLIVDEVYLNRWGESIQITGWTRGKAGEIAYGANGEWFEAATGRVMHCFGHIPDGTFRNNDWRNLVALERDRPGTIPVSPETKLYPGVEVDPKFLPYNI